VTEPRCGSVIDHAPHMFMMMPGRKFSTCPGSGEVALSQVETPQIAPLAQLEEAVRSVHIEHAQMARLLVTCTCPEQAANVEDCPVHGAVRAFDSLAGILNAAPRQLREILEDYDPDEGSVELVIERFAQWLEIAVSQALIY
jgi:hypothetical protein